MLVAHVFRVPVWDKVKPSPRYGPGMWWRGLSLNRSRLLCPELTDPLKGCEPTKTLQALGEVVGIEERGQVRSQALVACRNRTVGPWRP